MNYDRIANQRPSVSLFLWPTSSQLVVVIFPFDLPLYAFQDSGAVPNIVLFQELMLSFSPVL